MRNRVLALLATLSLLLGYAGSAQAIVGGQPDGENHPYEALILVPGDGYCTGTLVSPTVVLTAGHCTTFFEEVGAENVLVSFDPEPAVTDDWVPVDASEWETVSDVLTHPDYVGEDWPNTIDAGVVVLSEPVDIEPAQLPEAGLLDELIPTNGTTRQSFTDVGYGISSYEHGLPTGVIVRKAAQQRYAVGRGIGVGSGLTDIWLNLRNAPSAQHGGSCPGDSGSGVFLGDTDTIVAVHMGGYPLGREGSLCGRITALNLRVDIPVVLDWLEQVIATH